MPTLREFIENREKEIREQMKLLRQELKEIKAVKATLDRSGAPQGRRKELTIKEKIMIVLREMEQGTANQILDAIQKKFGERILRPSLSPQLSRLRRQGRVDFRDGIWFLKGAASDAESEAEKHIGVGMVRGSGYPPGAPEGSNPSNSTVSRQEHTPDTPDDDDSWSF